MDSQIDGTILVVVGVLAIFFRKSFAKFVMWYHTNRWYRRKRSKSKSQYPKKAWSTSNRLIQIYALIIGASFVLIGCLLLFGISVSEPNVNIIYHSEELAAQQAVQFIEIALINRDHAQAYLLFSRNSRKNFSFERSKSLYEEIPPEYFPAVIRATDYEPIPGQRGMHIFLSSANERKKLYYRLIMEGTKQTNYKVLDIHYSKDPYPPSKLRRPLEMRITDGS